MADVGEPTPRFDQKVSITTTERGKITLRLVDRINVDDVFVHLVNREIFRLLVGDDAGAEVNQNFKDFLLKERFTAGQ